MNLIYDNENRESERFIDSDVVHTKVYSDYNTIVATSVALRMCRARHAASSLSSLWSWPLYVALHQGSGAHPN